MNFKYLGLKKLSACNLKTEKKNPKRFPFNLFSMSIVHRAEVLDKFKILYFTGSSHHMNHSYPQQQFLHTVAAWLRHCGKDAAAFPLETAVPVWHNWWQAFCITKLGLQNLSLEQNAFSKRVEQPLKNNLCWANDVGTVSQADQVPFGWWTMAG